MTTTTQQPARTGQAAHITESDVRAWLAERANQVLLRNENLISANLKIESRSGAYSICLIVRTVAGVDFCRHGSTVAEAEAELDRAIPTPRSEAERLRSEAAQMLATAARLEQSTAA